MRAVLRVARAAQRPDCCCKSLELCSFAVWWCNALMCNGSVFLDAAKDR